MRRLIVAALFLLTAPAGAQDDLSTIAVPIRTSLASLSPLVEQRVPKTIENSVQELGTKVRYEVTRDPIRLEMIGSGLHSSTTAHYALEACAFRLRCLSCGVNEKKRDAVIRLHSRFVWDTTWRLRSTTEAQPAEFPDRCRLTALGVDITDRFIAPIVNDQLQDVAETIDQNLPSLANMQPIAQDVWRSLQQPSEVADRTWIVFEPLSAALSPVTGSGMDVTTTLTLRARTRLVVGEKPPAGNVALPSLVVGGSPPGFRVPFDIEMAYGEASRLATEEFGNREYTMQDDRLRIDGIALGAGRAGKVSLIANVHTSRYDGPVTLEGMPRFDAVTRTVTVPDLDYSLETRDRSLFFKIGEKLAHEGVRARLRESARWPLKDQIALATDEINKAMNREISPGVTLRGEVSAIEPQRVTAGDAGLVVRVIVTGAARIDVTQRP